MRDAATDDLPDDIHTVILGIGDLNGILRGKRITAAHWPSVRKRGMALDNSFFALDVASHQIPNSWSGDQTGCPDLHIFPSGPLRPVPWEEGVIFAIGEAVERDGKTSPLDPRPVLQRVLAKADEMNFHIRIGAELEFYLYDRETGLPTEERSDCYGLDRAATMEHVLAPIRAHLLAMGIPIEQSNPEFAPGQVEVNIKHSPAAEAAEYALLMRGMVKQIARREGMRATFMPKPYAELSGSGFHLHHSVWRQGVNLFAEDGTLSPMGRSYLAGMQRRMAECSLVGGPMPNSYRRRKAYSYAPVTASWGFDNRSVALRVIEGENRAVRIEAREAGADANPWLLAAVQIAAGLEGVVEGLAPDAPVEGDAYKADWPAPLPTTMEAAIEAARDSSFLKGLLGEHLLGILIKQAEQEHELVETQVTPVETKRYLDAM